MRILEFFQEPQGGYSSQRLVFVFTSLVFVAAILYLTLKKSAFPDLPIGLVYFYSAVALGKVGQSYIETKMPTPTVVTPVTTTTPGIPTIILPPTPSA